MTALAGESWSLNNISKKLKRMLNKEGE